MSPSESISDREKLIREGFCFDSDRDCEAARYLIGVIDVIRGERDALRAALQALVGLLEEDDQYAETISMQMAYEALASTPKRDIQADCSIPQERKL